MGELTYKQWLDKVDEHVWATVGCSVHDLPDCPFHYWYEDSIAPIVAAGRAISRSDYAQLIHVGGVKSGNSRVFRREDDQEHYSF